MKEIRNSKTSRKTVFTSKLTQYQVDQIDKFLGDLGEFGEIRLIVEKGKVRFINKLESVKAWDNRKPS